MKYLVVPLFLLLVFNPVLSSDQSQQQIEEPKTNIESFWPYFTPYKSPALVDGIGNSSLLITTRSEMTQKFFNQGLSLLHCFWWFEALRAFKKTMTPVRCPIGEFIWHYLAVDLLLWKIKKPKCK